MNRNRHIARNRNALRSTIFLSALLMENRIFETETNDRRLVINVEQKGAGTSISITGYRNDQEIGFKQDILLQKCQNRLNTLIDNPQNDEQKKLREYLLTYMEDIPDDFLLNRDKRADNILSTFVYNMKQLKLLQDYREITKNGRKRYFWRLKLNFFASDVRGMISEIEQKWEETFTRNRPLITSEKIDVKTMQKYSYQTIDLANHRMEKSTLNFLTKLKQETGNKIIVLVI